MSGVASSGVGVNINTTASGTGAQQTVTGLASVSGGIGQMAGVAAEGTQSLDGMARSIRGMGTVLIGINPVLGAAAIGLGMFIEEIYKVQQAADKLNLKNIQDQFKTVEETSKQYIENLQKLDNVELAHHRDALAEIAKHWQTINELQQQSLRTEGEMEKAEQAYRAVKLKEAELGELEGLQPGDVQGRKAVRDKYKDYSARSVAQAQAAKAQAEFDRATSQIDPAEERRKQVEAAQARYQADVDAAKGVGASAYSDLRNQGMISDQDRQLNQLKALQKTQADPQFNTIDIDRRAQINREAAELEKVAGRNRDQIATGKATFNEQARELKEIGQDKGSTAGAKLNAASGIAAIEEWQGKIKAASDTLDKSGPKIEEFADALTKATAALKSAQDNAAAAGIKASASSREVPVVVREEEQKSRESAAAEANKEKAESLRDSIQAAEGKVRSDERLLGQKLQDAENAAKLHVKAGDAGAQSNLDRIAAVKRSIQEAGGDSKKIESALNSLAASVSSTGSQSVNAIRQLSSELAGYKNELESLKAESRSRAATQSQ